ncbi:helix-turn-helix domain-containing protein [Variovorax boronicumulans]|uniref:helix-turn-helix domain-containing protein n=1 Tax=Variovorax boronicumulans TaxID=436515 RepID=UPI001F0A3486|nr:helix-turn-helix domain-containing protein [Variovorax boronicumulans]
MSDTTGAHSVKSIDALRRGLDVMLAIQRSSAVTLQELHRQTGLSKATLLRILKTLQQAGWVERNELEKRYVPTSATGQSGAAAAWRTRLTALAASPRATLQRLVPWPIDLGVRDGTAMLILDTDRPRNGLAVNYRALGFRPPMLLSSLGRCYLAFCPRMNGEKSLRRWRVHRTISTAARDAPTASAAWWRMRATRATRRATPRPPASIRPTASARCRCRCGWASRWWAASAARGCRR